MLEDEALGFCYALQCYSSQNENSTRPQWLAMGVTSCMA